MATSKKVPPTRKASSKSKSSAARVETGPLPPYGDPIHKAIARGDLQGNESSRNQYAQMADQSELRSYQT